jgi:hypothetical protein
MSFMRISQNLLKTLLCSSLVCLSACRGTSYQYVIENSGIRYEMKVPVDATTAGFDFSVVTNNALPVIESDYPMISADYSSEAGAADKLKKLKVRLLIDEKEIAADETQYEATHFGKTITLTEAECCENLGRKLEIGKSKPDTEYGFGVHIVKKYKSLKMLPPEIKVVLSATTAKGMFEITQKLTLKASEDSNFIRVH